MVAPVASAPISVPPPRPRLKRSHPSEPTAADDIGALSLPPPPQPIAVPVAASPTALPTGAIVAAPWSTLSAARGGGTGLDPIHELAELQGQDNLGLASPPPDGLALGLDLSGQGGGGADAGDLGADAAVERRAAKRIRVAPDHEAFGRLSLDRLSPTTSPTSPLPAQLFPAGPSPSPQSAVPPHLLRQPSQPLPTPPLGSVSAFPSPVTSNPLRSPPRQFINSSAPAPPAPTQHAAFSSPTLASASLPSAPPTSPVQPAAFPGAPTASVEGFSSPLVVNAHTPGSGVLPTVPWGQSTFFSPAPPPTTAPVPPAVHNISPPAPVPAQPFSAQPPSSVDEIEMGSANASSWDLDPHRIYVASLEDEEDAADKSAAAAETSQQTTHKDDEQQRLRLNEVVARRAAEEASALPAALIAQLEREASKAREGSLVLYRPPPWAAAARRTSLHDDATTFNQQRELEKHEESWREFERERQRVEREQDAHLDADDEEAMSDDAGGTGFDGETLVGGDEGGMDVDMEL